MNHIESSRLFELAQLSAIVDQPEWEHIKNCEDCGIAFIQLKDVIKYCASGATA
jgi:hypothetical protein